MPDKFLAVVDAGTNSFHLIIVKILPNNEFEIVDRERIVVRLGSRGSHILNKIDNEEIERVTRVLNLFKLKAEKYNTKLEVVATSAVREAENREVFVSEILKRTGVQINVIDGKTEAEYIYYGVKKGLNIINKKILVIDIGGGSTEFIVGQNDKIYFAESLKIGAVRLSKQFFPDYKLNNERINMCRDFIINEINLIKNEIIRLNPEFYSGSSGTIHSVMGMSLAQIKIKLKKPYNDINFTTLQLQSVVNNILSRKSVEERLKIKGLEEKRADIIPAGVLILDSIFNIFSIKEMTVSAFALREGVILSLMNRL